MKKSERNDIDRRLQLDKFKKYCEKTGRTEKTSNVYADRIASIQRKADKSILVMTYKELETHLTTIIESTKSGETVNNLITALSAYSEYTGEYLNSPLPDFKAMRKKVGFKKKRII